MDNLLTGDIDTDYGLFHQMVSEMRIKHPEAISAYMLIYAVNRIYGQPTESTIRNEVPLDNLVFFPSRF